MYGDNKLRLIYPFTVSFVVGTLIFLVIFLLDFGPRYQLLSTAVVLAYGGAVAFFYRHNDTAPDSVYYLGFIFTLEALSFSLFPMMKDLDALFVNGTLATTVLASFSVAFSTTLVGLIFRTFLSEFQRMDLPQSDPGAEHANLTVILQEIGVEFALLRQDLKLSRGELKSAFEETSSTLRKSANSLEENAASTSSTVIETLNTAVGHFEKNATAMSETMFNNLAETSKKIKEELRLTDEAHRDAIVKFFSTMESTSNKFELMLTELTGIAGGSAAQIQEVIEQQREFATASIKKSKEDFEILSNEIDVNRSRLLEDSKKSISSLSEHSRGEIESVTEIQPKLDKILLSLVKTAEVTANIHDSFKSIANEASTTVSTMKGATENINGQIQGMEEITMAISKFTALSDSISELSDVMKSELKNAVSVNSELNKVILNSAQQVTSELTKIGKLGSRRS